MRKLDYNLIVSIKKGRSKIASKITLIAISLSVSVIIVALTVTQGFKNEISNHTTDLLNYIHITEQPSMFVGSDEVQLADSQIEDIEQLTSGQPLKGGVDVYAVLQNSSNVLPSMLVADDSNNIDSTSIVLSKSALDELDLEVGEMLDVVYFVDDIAKLKSLRVDSVYSSHLYDIEKQRAYISMGNARMLSGLEDGYYNYYAISHRFDTDALSQYLDEEMLIGQSVEERAPDLFGWLDMIEQNFNLVLIIMIVVAVINVLASTLIVILDNTPKIALLRSLGMNKKEVEKAYVIKIFRSGIRGILYGVVVGLLLSFLQMQFKIITLDEVSYLVDSVPIGFDFVKILGSCVIVAIFVLIAVVIPVRVISKVSISKALKYE